MPGIVHRVAQRDQALLERLLLSPTASRARRLFWSVVTHSGGVCASLSISLAPLWLDGALAEGARRATILLLTSHLMVQVVKRTVSRPRPVLRSPLSIRVPDRFSFPSGHAAAAASVALGYASTHSHLAIPMLAAAALVGMSRVVLGMHFPADVVAGQLLAFLTAVALAPVL
jgi:undecaprenyl-diphosphatase